MEQNIPPEQVKETINDVLARVNCTIELILDNDSFVEELKYYNEKLLHLYYLCCDLLVLPPI